MLLTMLLTVVGRLWKSSCRLCPSRLKTISLKRWPQVPTLMIDESTDISVLKQLVLVDCYILHTGDVTTSFVAFLAIDDLT